MVIQVNDKWKIKYDEQEKQYIYYRILDKSELSAHLNEADANLAVAEAIRATFQAYIDDERILEPKIIGEEL